MQSTDAIFNCRAEAIPKPKIRWLKLYSAMSQSRATTDADGNGTLVIRNVGRQNAGTYVCVAENILGTAKSYAVLVVRGKSRIRFKL